MQWGITNEYWKALQDSLYRYPNRVHSVSQATEEEIRQRLTPADRGGTKLHLTAKDGGYFDVWYSSGIVPPAKRG